METHVHPSEREPRRGVIKGGPQPGNGGMALGTVGRIRTRHVIGVSGSLKILQMTRHTLGGYRDEDRAALRGGVAGLALHREMGAGERETRQLVGTGHGGAIKEAPGAMTACAVRPNLAAVRVAMTRDALARSTPEVQRDVAAPARCGRMGAKQWELPRATMVEGVADPRRCPALRAVAFTTRLRERPVRVLNGGLLCARDRGTQEETATQHLLPHGALPRGQLRLSELQIPYGIPPVA